MDEQIHKFVTYHLSEISTSELPLSMHSIFKWLGVGALHWLTFSSIAFQMDQKLSIGEASSYATHVHPQSKKNDPLVEVDACKKQGIYPQHKLSNSNKWNTQHNSPGTRQSNQMTSTEALDLDLSLGLPPREKRSHNNFHWLCDYAGVVDQNICMPGMVQDLEMHSLSHGSFQAKRHCVNSPILVSPMGNSGTSWLTLGNSGQGPEQNSGAGLKKMDSHKSYIGASHPVDSKIPWLTLGHDYTFSNEHDGRFDNLK